jgi:hypothetical protein
VTAHLVVCCDGTPTVRPTIPLGRCRAFLAQRSSDGVHMDELRAAGWSRIAVDTHLCHDCTRAATSS